MHDRRLRGLSLWAACLVSLWVGPSCDDPPDTEQVGGLVLMFRTFPATEGRFAEVERITVNFNKVVVLLQAEGSQEEQQVTVDTQPRTLALLNAQRDVLVGQYPVPLGTVRQVRIFATQVVLDLKDGSHVTLTPDGKDLPSWDNTGWKIGSDTATFLVTQDALTGMRALFHFQDRLVRPGGKKSSGWKVKPTVDAERFDVNPPPDAPGVFFDQLTVVFRPGTPRTRIAEINAAIKANVLITPRLTTWYRIKLPATYNLEQALAYYREQPEVSEVLPAVNFAGQLDPNDDPNTARTDLIRMRPAWDRSQGSHAVRVAVIDTGVDFTHADLYRNIAINQGELPPGLFDTDGDGTVTPAELATFDLDPAGTPDGLITIRDLEASPAGSPVRPPDVNGNGRIDGEDLISDGRWANGVNEDGNGVTADDPLGFVDDLVGWNFTTGTNDPRPNGSSHGTVVAGIIGAEGNNGQDMAGLNWRASIVPLRASVGTDTVPDVRFADAVRYAESLRVDVVNVSQGWHFARDGHDYTCGEKETQTTGGIEEDTFNEGVTEANQAYSDLFAGARALWVFAAGNSRHGMDAQSLLLLPQEAVLSAIPDRMLIVGSVNDSGRASEFSNHGVNTVQLHAPGEDWVSTRPGGGTNSGNDGTSFSAPAVAGAAALYASLRAGVRGDAPAIRQALLDSAATTVSVGCDRNVSGQRLLDVDALLQR